jgi:acetyl-CoA acetyltransferase
MVPRDYNPHLGLLEKIPGLYMVMGKTAEVVAKRYKVNRES